MNPTHQRQIDDDARFDLLADGELSEAERRELLGGLDEEPSGWRRCALAFLEAQAWRRELGAMARQSGRTSPDKRPLRRFRPGSGGGTLLAMAASFLVALLLGLVIRDLSHRSAPHGSPSVQMADNHENVRDRDRRPKQPERTPAEVCPRPDEAPASTRMVADTDSIAVPAGRVDDLDEWLNGLPAVIPEDLKQALERTGYRVRQSRELVPMGVEDGRQLVVPVDKVNIHYVGNPPL